MLVGFGLQGRRKRSAHRLVVRVQEERPPSLAGGRSGRRGCRIPQVGASSLSHIIYPQLSDAAGSPYGGRA